MTDFEDCSNPYDWQLGVHGIYIYLSPSTSWKSSETLTATFLPDVAEEQGWDQRTTLVQAIKKSGYRFVSRPASLHSYKELTRVWDSSKIDDEVIAGLRVRRYQSSVIRVSYQEWKAQA